MANEAVQIVAPTKIYSGTIANGTAITKYTLMALSADPNTITANAGGGGQIFSGIAMEDKVASDGKVRMSLAQDGVFDLKLDTNSTCTYGDILILSGTNTVASAKHWAGTAAALYLSGMAVGMARETGSAAEVVAVDIGRKR